MRPPMTRQDVNPMRIRRLLFSFAVGLGLTLAVLAGLDANLPGARADTYTVVNTNASGSGSLRQAILDGNGSAGHDTIDFSITGTIVLTDALPAISDDLTITGPGADELDIRGANTYRVFTINSGAAVTITGVTVRDGSADSGGGIWTAGDLHLGASHILSNSAAVDGGGVFVDEGSATLSGTLVVSNSATASGGGVYVYQDGATLNLRGGEIHLHPAEGGGGVFVHLGSATLSGTHVLSNSAGYGGGLYAWGVSATLNMNGGEIGNNSAAYGGAVYADQGSATLTGTQVVSNSAWYGGGLYVRDGSATLSGTQLISNSADVDGGGVYIYSGSGTLKISGGRVYSNSAEGGGGVYVVWGSATLSGTQVLSNSADVDGGGVFVDQGSATLSGTQVLGNSADHGGGILNYGTLTVVHSTISDNTANAYGGGLWNSQDGTASVDASTIGDNRATVSGGGVYNDWGTITVTSSRILNNSATDNGGGLFNDEDTAGATDVTGSCIVGNSASSFYNNQPAGQITTGNWWGGTTGPNTPGADTVSGTVDVSGYLTAPILGCAPELRVGKANDTDGNGTVGTPFHWTLTVSNTGLISAAFDSGETILLDDLPAGPTYSAPVVGNLVDVAAGDNIDCSLEDNTLTCEASGGDVTLGPVTGRFEVTFSVTPNSPVTLVNPAGVCQVDPDGNVIENDESDNNCPANVVDVGVSTIYVYLPVVQR